MNNQLKLEELATFCLSIFFFYQTNFEWWWFLALILAPDIGMLGYLINTKIGAFSYNLLHHKGVAILVLCAGWLTENAWVELSGIIMLGHASLDRIFGYGLKYSDDFHHTHLGWLKGKDENTTNSVEQV